MTTDVYKKALEKFDVTNPLSWAGFFEVISDFTKDAPPFKDLLKPPAGFLDNLYSMGIYFFGEKKFDPARQIFNLLYYYDVRNPRYIFCLAASEQALGNIHGALSHYLLSASLDPQNPEPLYYAAELSLALKKEEAAYQFFKQVIGLAKDKKQYAVIKDRSEAILMGAKKK